MDRIFLRQLEIDTVIGIWEWERRMKQTVSIDLEMATDARNRSTSKADNVGDTLNYRDVAKRLIDFVGKSEFQLVETLADAAAGIVIREFGVPWVKLSVGKPGAIAGSKIVGVTIERTVEDYGD